MKQFLQLNFIRSADVGNESAPKNRNVLLDMVGLMNQMVHRKENGDYEYSCEDEFWNHLSFLQKSEMWFV